MMQLPLPFVAQRWRARCPTYRPQGEPFDPRRYAVVRLPKQAEPKDFVERHHYSGAYPAAVAAYGLMEARPNRASALVGVAVFSVPIQPRAAAAYGAAEARACDLGRFVLLDHVAGNAETWFLRRALAGLAADKLDEHDRPRFDLCLAYSDPLPRVDACGLARFAGHYGGIYAASSALYLGRAKPRSLWIAPDASVLSERALAKLRSDDCGARYTYEMLRRHGAPAIEHGEPNRAYLARALASGVFRQVRHRGNHIYAFACGTHSVRATMRTRLRTGLPYPKFTDPVASTMAPIAAADLETHRLWT